MGWKRIIGKLLLIGIGGGCLVLIIFVGLPWLTPQLEVAEPPQPPGTEELVAQVLNTPQTEGPDDVVEEGVMPAPSPLVAVRENGEEVAIVFPAADGAASQEEPVAAAEVPTDEEEQEEATDPAEELTPVLSAEEVAAAMAFLEDGGEEYTGPVALPDARPDSESELGAAEGFRLAKRERRQPEAVLVGDSHGSHREGMPLPPPSATREVQQFLEALGYDPGPVDGIWGERTARAWRSYARDTDKPAAGMELAQSQPEENAEPPSTVSPTPSGETVEPEGPGAGQAGETRHTAGLPSQETAQPVVVPATLRGVMGYRMPLVSRQGVPDQVVSGVLIPAHTTFVILKSGYWELVGLEPGEVERLREADERESMPGSEADKQPVKRVWNPLRLFRKQGPHANGG